MIEHMISTRSSVDAVMLILSVNSTGPQGAQLFGQTLFWVFLWGCFWMRLTFKLTFKLVDWIKKIPLHNVESLSVIQSSESLNRLTLPWVRENFSSLTTFKAEINFFPASGLECKHWFFLCLKPAGLWTGTIHRFSWASNLLTHLADSGTCHLHNHMSLFLLINSFIHTHTHTHDLSVLFFLENSDGYECHP